MREPIFVDKTRGEDIYTGLDRAGYFPNPTYKMQPNGMGRQVGGFNPQGNPSLLQRAGQYLGNRIDDAYTGLRRTGNFIRKEGFPGFLTAPLPQQDQQAATRIQKEIRTNPLKYAGMAGGITPVSGRVPLPQGQVNRELLKYGKDNIKALAPRLTPDRIKALSGGDPTLRQVFESMVNLVK